ncbi:hypothetical protein WISP_74591 [Willisornis vidua]|uniref:Uncharacterized protein n=1 Tax=Willisornis vidua TaxID=1566151 RepID=A0ABQ9D773_9PASS|nr:hypothetical protein WISP_74591 [Willisornis vidua]
MASGILALISNSVPSRTREGIVSVVNADETEPVFTFGTPHYNKDLEVLECLQRREMKMVKVLEHRS